MKHCLIQCYKFGLVLVLQVWRPTVSWRSCFRSNWVSDWLTFLRSKKFLYHSSIFISRNVRKSTPGLGISNWIVNLYVFYYYCNLWWMINFDVKLRMLKYCKIFSMYVSGVRVVLELRVSLSLNLWELISISNQACSVAEPNHNHFYL